MLKFNRAYLSTLIVLAGAIGFLSFGSYVEGEETRSAMSALSINKTTPIELLKPHMSEQGYVVIEERRYGSDHGEKSGMCEAGEVGQMTFESRDPDADKLIIKFGYQITPTGCKIRIHTIDAFSN